MKFLIGWITDFAHTFKNCHGSVATRVCHNTWFLRSKLYCVRQPAMLLILDVLAESVAMTPEHIQHVFVDKQLL